MKRDPLIIGTASVIIIAFTLSLLNIYVFPNLFYQVDVYRNTEDTLKLEILGTIEDIGINSSYFDELNRTNIWKDYPEITIINITVMLTNINLHLSAAYDAQDLTPRRMRLNYNGTIIGAANDSVTYNNYILNIFDDGSNGSYFGFLNSSMEFEICSNFANAGTNAYNADDIIGNLTEIFADENRKPDFIIYQTVSYFESRGLLNEYSTDFERIVFVNVHGDVSLFLSNEGFWNVPIIF